MTAQPDPLRISRTYPFPRELVFAAWSSADHVKRWFSPHDYPITDANVDMRPGGVFEWCMQGPDGVGMWTRGTVAEADPPARLALDLRVVNSDGSPLFHALTEVDFVTVPEGTRLDVVQSYTFNDPAVAAAMVAGAPQGWRETLDKLTVELVRMTKAD